MTEDASTTGTEPEGPVLFDPPEDVPEGEATGYAVYDRVLGQYVSEVYRDSKPTAKQASELAEHAAIVRV